MNTLFLEIDGGKIAYDVSGSGPLIINSPSLGDLRGEYRFLIPHLVSAGYRVASMDLRGHGESSTDWADFSVAAIGSDMLALIRELGGGPAVIIGTSVSAGAAVWAAAEAPQLISGLVLVGPFVRGTMTWKDYLLRLLLLIMFSRPWGPAMWQRYYASLYPTHKPQDFEAYSAALRASLQAPGRMEALRRVLAAPKTASEERLPQVRTPVLVLMGSKDPDFKDPEAEARWVAESLSGSYQMIPGAGHYPHAEMPEETGARVVPFLETLRSPTHDFAVQALGA